MRCSTFCIANGLSLSKIQRHFKHLGYSSHLFDEVIHLNLKANTHLYYFKNGAIVSWGLNKNQVKPYIDMVAEFRINPDEIIERDDFIYQISDNTLAHIHEYFNVDIIELEDDNEVRLALSYGLSQSSKLQLYERQIAALVDKYSMLVQDLAEHGKIKLSRKQISQIMGRIFMAKSMVNLKSEYLGVPKYFWQRPNTQPHYEMIIHYLDLNKRVAALNQKLDILNETFDMLSSQLQHGYTNFLEVIIIVLLVVEITLAFIPLFK